MRAFLELIAILLRLAGLTMIVFGLWYSTGGVRLIVSGRIDERNEARQSLRLGVPILVGGIVVLMFGFWLEKHL